MKQSVVLLFAANCILIYAQDAGPPGLVTIMNVTKCNPDVKTTDYDFHLVDKDNEKSFDFTFKILEASGPELQLTVTVDRLKDGEWEKDVFSIEDKPVLEFLDEKFKKAWKNMREAFSPKILEANGIPAGEYTLKNYKETSKNLELPAILYGIFRAKTTLSKNDVDQMCIMAEIESKPPSVF